MIQPIKIKFVLVNTIKTFILLLVLLLNPGRTSAQGMEYWVDILGDVSVPKGNTAIYTMPDFDLITNYGANQILSFNWQVAGGKLKKVVNGANGNPIVIESSNNNSYNSSYGNSDSGYYQWSELTGAEQLLSPDRVAVEWTNPDGYGGMGCYIETDWDSYFGSLDVELTGLDTPNNPTITNVLCGQSTLTRTGTPSSDYLWFWQGKNPNGTTQDKGSNPTFIANEGSGTYYIRAWDMYGNWSVKSGSVYVEISQTQKWYLDTDKDGYGSSNYINSCADPSTTDTKYVSNNSDLNDSESLISLATQWCLDINGDGVITDLDTSYAHYNCVNSTVRPDPVYDKKYIPTMVENSHWIHNASFDPDGFVIGSSKTYFDDLGKANVSLSKDYVTNTIWGTETAYDNFGRSDKTTFIVPSGYDHFVKTGFLTSNNGATASSYPSTLPLNNITASNDYKATQSITVTGTVSPGLNVNLTAPTITLSNGFTISATSGSNFTITAATLPNVSGNQGLISNYYTDANTLEPFQATAEQPYSQTNYDTLNPGNVINVVGGNKINGDWKTGYSYTVPAAQEMYYVYGTDYYEGAITAGKEEVITKFFKSVSVDANGVENVAFSDGEGKVLASARSGGTISYPVVSLIGTQGFVDVHIPAGITSGISLLGGSSLYKVYNLKTGLITTSLTGGNAYRIEAITPPTTDPKTYIIIPPSGVLTYDAGALGITYSVNYYDYSVNVYNKTGQLIKSIQPNGYAANTTNGTIVGTPPYLASGKFTSTYTYNDQGQIKSTTSTDEGNSQFAYRQDGQIRYSQSALQASLNNISYTNYDSYGRPIESGVITGAPWADALAGADAITLIGSQLSERTFTVYDYTENTTTSSQILTPYSITIPASLSLATLAPSYIQNNLSGNVAVTYKSDSGTTINAITWYSYDIYGRSEWMVQYNEGIGTKTIHYEYDYKGNVKKVLYQQDNSAELFVHRYIYNANDVLQKVQTSTNNTTFTTHADYSYYLTGELKRVNIAKGLQGLDYVYTLGGQLKSINHPSLEAAKDPGGDGNDVFGITLDYYSGDYLRTGRNITSSSTAGADYNGNIKAARWANKGVVGDYNGTTASQKGYLYTYNRNNWLTEASYGNANSSDAIIPASNSSYKEGNLTYDANGNIETLQRTNAAGTMQDNLSYTYNIENNQLNRVADAAGASTSASDIGTQTAGNYRYDVIGQMTRNNLEDIDYAYNTQGLVTQVSKAGHILVKFFYNERGQRIKKESYNTANPFLLTSTDYYILDLSGNAMAIYNQTSGNAIVQKDLPIFGLSRLGVFNRASGGTSTYEITDHLGNVRAVVQKNASTGLTDIKSFADYYPFGEKLIGRSVTNDYRYAFQGQELDTETNMEAFQLRLWDGRIGRWLSPDPYGQYDSPYLGMGNNPIGTIDPDGGYTSEFWANWHNFWSGGNGTVFKSEKNGDWGIRTVTGNGSSYEDGLTISTTFGGKRYGGNEIRAYEPNFFGRIQENYLNSNINDNFLQSSLKTLGNVGYNIADDAFVYGTRNFTKTGGVHLNRDGADPNEVLNSGLNTIMLITPTPIKGSLFGVKYSAAPPSLVSKFNVASFGSTFKGTFLTKLAPATRGTVIVKMNQVLTFVTSRGMFVTSSKSVSKKINQE